MLVLKVKVRMTTTQVLKIKRTITVKQRYLKLTRQIIVKINKSTKDMNFANAKYCKIFREKNIFFLIE